MVLGGGFSAGYVGEYKYIEKPRIITSLYLYITRYYYRVFRFAVVVPERSRNRPLRAVGLVISCSRTSISKIKDWIRYNFGVYIIILVLIYIHILSIFFYTDAAVTSIIAATY